MLNVIRNRDKEWNYNQITFDQGNTTLNLNAYTMTIITMLFPNIENIKLKLKPGSDLSDYLFQDLLEFKNLKKISLVITDGASYNPRSPINIETLKIYYNTIWANDHYLKLVLRKVNSLKSLTICEAYIPATTMSFLVNQQIEKLSIKNPYITKAETTNFINIIHNFKLKKFKLIHTQVNDLEAEQVLLYITMNYLEILPHENLESLSISLPSCYENVNYSKIVTELKKLTKLNIFMSTNNNFNNINQIIELLNIVPYYLKTTIIYYRTERSLRTHLNDLQILKANYPQIKVIEKINPYITYPDLIKIDQGKNKVTSYKRTMADIKEPKPYIAENAMTVHNFPLIAPYNEDLEHIDIDLHEYLTSEDSNDLENIDIDTIDSLIKEENIEITDTDLSEQIISVENESITVDIENVEQISSTEYENVIVDIETAEITNTTIENIKRRRRSC